VDRYGAGRVPFFSAWLAIFLMLAFDEIRLYGNYLSPGHAPIAYRPLRSRASRTARATKALRHYIEHLDISVKESIKDIEDQTTALQQDRQGLRLSRW
jgi:hypothetical protein